MRLFSLRAGRRSLAHTFTSLVAFAALGACVDEPVGPKNLSTTGPQASALAVDPIDVMVTNTSGGTEADPASIAARGFA